MIDWKENHPALPEAYAELLLRLLLFDPLADRVAHEARHLDGAAHLAFGFLERLRHTLVGVVNITLIEQADFLVEGLQPGFDDLLDDVRGLALRLVLVG